MAAVGGGVKGMKSVLSSRDAKESQCSARHVSLSALFRLFVIATCLKLLLVPSYHSTDFEVHRNWLAVTHSLPINQWYVDETSPWTLDYPPFFAWFERLLSVPASHVEPKMVHLKEGLNHASDRAVLFQRATVMAADIILFASVYYFLRGGQQWSWTAQRDRLLGFAILLSPGLMIVDHIHFQYNGMLMGMLIFSLSMMERGDRDLQGAVVFAILVCFKHLFAVAGPLYAVYLLRHYCGGNVGKAMGSFVKLGGSVLGVVAVAFGPFVLHGQVQQVLRRLFPFGRGLCHAYWAPNAWAIYNVADKALTVLLPMVGIPVSKQHASMTGGLVGDSAGHVVLPQIRPPMAMVLTLVAMVPCLVRAWRHPRPREFIRLVVYANLCGFMFGWHVHEKAALTFVVPFSLISTNSAEEAGEFLFLSTEEREGEEEEEEEEWEGREKEREEAWEKEGKEQERGYGAGRGGGGGGGGTGGKAGEAAEGGRAAGGAGGAATEGAGEGEGGVGEGACAKRCTVLREYVGIIPRATLRWWIKRRMVVDQTWEDLRQYGYATNYFFREKLRMSLRVFREIAKACAPRLQWQMTFYRESLQPDQIVAYALYMWVLGETYESNTCNLDIGRASSLVAVRDFTAALLRVYADNIAWSTGVRKLVGYRSSCHYMRVLQLSSLWACAEAGSLFRGPPVILSHGVRTSGYLLGDNGYPSLKWIVAAYGGINQHTDEERFDNKQGGERSCEEGVRRLKGMWRLFLRIHKTNLETVLQQFVAVCTIHIILIDAGILFDENLLWEVEANGVLQRMDLDIQCPLRPVCVETSTSEAFARPDALAERMKRE
ncbi:hypothetical protein CBR_g3471 [Chara braunii]|uniref:Alpha-1,3-glucosyltransferase n=1 Tax=Chara braunii TaxID=69332 RepID=A0A388JR34_CHABU|nr:hypothetical protein CBR_g3471 [Chara braunii]|eukprot:GBG60228.1 hypothetical protein CBR_g3471 [Chara braunii]